MEWITLQSPLLTPSNPLLFPISFFHLRSCSLCLFHPPLLLWHHRPLSFIVFPLRTFPLHRLDLVLPLPFIPDRCAVGYIGDLVFYILPIVVVAQRSRLEDGDLSIPRSLAGRLGYDRRRRSGLGEWNSSSIGSRSIGLGSFVEKVSLSISILCFSRKG